MKYNIGRGKNMSIAKAALVYFFSEKRNDSVLSWGDLQAMHDIVAIAGAEQQSFFTPVQVSACLANSPYWDKKLVRGFYKGFGKRGDANAYKPSEKSKAYYQEHLKPATTTP